MRHERKFVKGVIAEGYTMVGLNAALATARAVKYVLAENIPGDFVECGVWRGGNSMIAKKLFNNAKESRKVHLFDTYTGMTEPTDADRKVRGNAAATDKYKDVKKEGYVDWCYASLEDVQAGFSNLEIGTENVEFIKGDVLETLRVKKNIPESISVLRLDTDWYESTKLELELLYPLLSPRGILIIDDYSSWQGARKATDEYFEMVGKRPFFLYWVMVGVLVVKYRIL